MPYKIHKLPSGKFKLVREATDGKPARPMSKHPQTKATATAQLGAIKANEHESSDETPELMKATVDDVMGDVDSPRGGDQKNKKENIKSADPIKIPSARFSPKTKAGIEYRKKMKDRSEGKLHFSKSSVVPELMAGPPDEKRDESGKWTGGNGSGPLSSHHSEIIKSLRGRSKNFNQLGIKDGDEKHASLKELQSKGLIESVPNEGGMPTFRLTDSGNKHSAIMPRIDNHSKVAELMADVSGEARDETGKWTTGGNKAGGISPTKKHEIKMGKEASERGMARTDKPVPKFKEPSGLGNTSSNPKSSIPKQTEYKFPDGSDSAGPPMTPKQQSEADKRAYGVDRNTWSRPMVGTSSASQPKPKVATIPDRPSSQDFTSAFGLNKGDLAAAGRGGKQSMVGTQHSKKLQFEKMSSGKIRVNRNSPEMMHGPKNEPRGHDSKWTAKSSKHTKIN